jgi:hypothetical protein
MALVLKAKKDVDVSRRQWPASQCFEDQELLRTSAEGESSAVILIIIIIESLTYQLT